MPGVRSFSPVTVFADSGDTDREARLNRDELSLYAAPQPRCRHVEPEAGHVERSVASLRTRVEPYLVWCRDTYGKVHPQIRNAVQLGGDTYDYLKNPPKDFYPRAAVIGFTGILGIFLARGSRIKKIIYPAGLVTLSASLYYPEQAVNIARSTGDSVYDCAVQSYVAVEKMLNPPSKGEQEHKSKP
ncbi:MICOS complex subunit MIC26-like [Aulostomus maculatus]